MGPAEAMVQVARESEHFWKILRSLINSFWSTKPLLPEKLRPPGSENENYRKYYQLLNYREFNISTKNYKNHTIYADYGTEQNGDSAAPISKIFNEQAV